MNDNPEAKPSGEVSVRPWGHYMVLAETPGFKIKEIVVLPGHKLSLQRHQRRHEHWFVQHGVAQVELDGRTQALAAGGSIDIPARAWHRMANGTGSPITVIEIQTGAYFGEDDIERASDDYGRAC